MFVFLVLNLQKYQQHNKGGANQQQKQQRSVNNYNDQRNDYRNGRNDDTNVASSSSMEYGSPQKQLLPVSLKFSSNDWKEGKSSIVFEIGARSSGKGRTQN